MIRLLLFSLLALALANVPAVLAQPIGTPPTADSVDAPPGRSLQFSYAYMNPVSYRGRTFRVYQYGICWLGTAPVVSQRYPGRSGIVGVLKRTGQVVLLPDLTHVPVPVWSAEPIPSGERRR